MAADSRTLAPAWPGSVCFRAMTPGDLDAVTAIEAGAYDFPWSRRAFEQCLAAGDECWLALAGESTENPGRHLAGYAIMSAAVAEAQLLNVCIEAKLRGRGHGRALARHMMERAAARGAKIVFLEVRLSNRIAMTLYATIGFREVGRRRGYYRAKGGREDAMVMALTLDGMAALNGASRGADRAGRVD